MKKIILDKTLIGKKYPEINFDVEIEILRLFSKAPVKKIPFTSMKKLHQGRPPIYISSPNFLDSCCYAARESLSLFN
ncbi:MAG: hypothetical protein Ct9H90mP20_3910 [Candidatus Neomarinimicrobiota bacterium]|nr:MAG: hypothetical protein Ct9H90mP20_3910 [Candidatus Neomarinimicrobiota bacterium]